MTEPAAVALHALRRVQTSLAGKTVAIFGAGPIGLMTAQWARIMGAAEIFLFDVITEKLELAQRIGFDNIFNSVTEDPVEIVNTRTERKRRACRVSRQREYLLPIAMLSAVLDAAVASFSSGILLQM